MIDRTNKACILVVRDSGEATGISRTLAEVMDTSFFECINAFGPEQALDAAGALPPDLIIMDMESPRAKGIEILRTLSGTESLVHIPIMVVSKYGSRQDKLASYSLGAKRFLSRPVDPELLMSEILTLLNREISRPN